jgi:hypothetical protein
VDTRDTNRLTGPERQDEEFRERGLGPLDPPRPLPAAAPVYSDGLLLRRLHRRVELLLRSGGAADGPERRAAQRRQAPPAGTELGDYVRVRGTANVGENLDRVGLRDSEIAISTRYSASYFYYRLQETQGNLLIQTRGSGSKRAIGNGLGIS